MNDGKNISKLEIESIIRNAKLIERYKNDIENGEQKDMLRDQYAIVFEAYVLKYLPRTKTMKCFRERSRFATDKTFKKFLHGKYVNISKVDKRILLKVCLGLTMEKQEIYDFFYVCGQSLYNNDECIEVKILNSLEKPEASLNETMKSYMAAYNINKANEIYESENQRGIYINCKREEKEAKEIFKGI